MLKEDGRKGRDDGRLKLNPVSSDSTRRLRARSSSSPHVSVGVSKLSIINEEKEGKQHERTRSRRKEKKTTKRSSATLQERED